MKRIFIKNLITNYNSEISAIEAELEFYPEIVNIATVNTEFRNFLSDFFDIWREEIHSRLLERVNWFFRSAESYAIRLDRENAIKTVLRIIAEEVANEVEAALVNKFVCTNFSTINLVQENVPVNYYKFKSDINNEFVYMAANSLLLNSSVLGKFSYDPVHKRTIRI